MNMKKYLEKKIILFLNRIIKKGNAGQPLKPAPNNNSPNASSSAISIWQVRLYLTAALIDV